MQRSGGGGKPPGRPGGPYGLVTAYERAMTGGGTQAGEEVRPEIEDSWARLRRLGLDPDRAREAHRVHPGRLEELRRATGLEPVLPVLRSTLFPPGAATPVVLAVSDPKARILWMDGERQLKREVDAIGFEQGALWSEDQVGTNGIGLAARTARPSVVHSAEHYLRSHHTWTCVGVPVRDPRTGRPAGVVNLSGPAAGDHPYLRQLALTAARLAETELRAAHLEALHRLRTVAVPLLARFGGPALVVDGAGWTAAAVGLPGPPRLALPPGDWGSGGLQWVPTLGECAVEPLADGWLIRPSGVRSAELAEQSEAAVLELDLRRPDRPELRVRGSAGAWSHTPSPRHTELLLLLALHRDGLSAARLAEALFAEPARTVTVRAELSRLRRHLGALLEARPYRLAAAAEVTVLGPDEPDDLLPGSAAPAVRVLRADLARGLLRLPGRAAAAQPSASSAANSASLGSSSMIWSSGTAV
ncbi:GAF domain-containing protein [Streptomyces sp. TLI_171]|uniref:GAF domain-containing protein n=1 Tax=Streptomyces sp. TLI_171 TaxID=1938859 RepID=UPI000C19BDD6|nr:GAF domain-containing protein [Streptomyces sp. TLI_171]RKE21706.1 GAF domain-containing protein [Streptomyces sp. TLI_171]